MTNYLDTATVWDWLGSGRVANYNEIQNAQNDLQAIEATADLLRRYYVKYAGYHLEFARVEHAGTIFVAFGYKDKDGGFYCCA